MAYVHRVPNLRKIDLNLVGHVSALNGEHPGDILHDNHGWAEEVGELQEPLVQVVSRVPKQAHRHCIEGSKLAASRLGPTLTRGATYDGQQLAGTRSEQVKKILRAEFRQVTVQGQPVREVQLVCPDGEWIVVDGYPWIKTGTVPPPGKPA